MAQVADHLVEDILARLTRRRTSENVAPVDDSARDIRKRITDSVIKSTHEVFQMMCGWPLEEMPTENLPDSELPRHDMSGIIGISGGLKATIVVSLTQELAFSMSEKMLGTRPQKIGPDVVDLVGEISNMITGNAKERMHMPGLILGLPTVVTGPGVRVAFDSGLSISKLLFQSDFGPLVIKIGLAS